LPARRIGSSEGEKLLEIDIQLARLVLLAQIAKTRIIFPPALKETRNRDKNALCQKILFSTCPTQLVAEISFLTSKETHASLDEFRDQGSGTDRVKCHKKEKP
jgi:hypothetical protein